MLKEAKTPQRERDSRGKVKNLHLQQNWKKKIQTKPRQRFVDGAT
jgi:hypothetical protein